MINIICLKWGHKYGPEYVNKLYGAVQRNVTVPYNFICFTDSTKNLTCTSRKIPSGTINLPHWWNKPSLFSEEANLNGPTFYIDLDTVITGNIDEIISTNKDFIILQDFYRGNRGGLQSSIMFWQHEKYRHVWEHFRSNIQKHITNPYGDQGYMEKILNKDTTSIWQKLFPNQIVSYKVHVRDQNRNKLPETAKIICFHGNPRPHMVKNLNWMKEHWV